MLHAHRHCLRSPANRLETPYQKTPNQTLTMLTFTIECNDTDFITGERGTITKNSVVVLEDDFRHPVEMTMEEHIRIQLGVITNDLIKSLKQNGTI
jgi:hypothetical protein